jgi:hypothetical protein
MHNARIAGHFPTYHPQNRPATVQIEIERGGRFESAQLPASEALGILQLPQLERAAFLASKPAARGVNIVGSETIGFGKPVKEVAKALGTGTIQSTADIDVHAFVRMLAKIGYAYAVAVDGPFPLTDVPVLPLIRGVADDGSTWVGSSDYRLAIENEKPQHALGLVQLPEISTEGLGNILVAQVKLFANVGATGYEVVVRRSSLPHQR